MDLKYAAIAAVLVLAIAGFAQAFGGFGNWGMWQQQGNSSYSSGNRTMPFQPFARGLMNANLTPLDLQAFYDLRKGNLTSADSSDLASWFSAHLNYNSTAADARFQLQAAKHELMGKLYSGQSLSDSEISQLNSVVRNLPSGEDFRGFGRMPGKMMRFGMRGRKGAATPVASPTG